MAENPAASFHYSNTPLLQHSTAPMRKKIIAANWKMNMTQAEAASFVGTFLLEIGESTEVEIVIVPPFTAIAAVNAALEQAQHIKVGAQNMHWERSGAFTGE